MSLNKPLLIFDGDCTFCRAWIARWKTITGEAVDYAPSQEVAAEYPDIPSQDFQKAVQLIEPDGTRTAAAKAVFRTLAYGGQPRWSQAYDKIPGFAALAEFAYQIIAGHRPTFSWLTRLLWGAPQIPSSYYLTCWLFHRAMALVYAIAFASYAVQIKGLIGANGIIPATDFLSRLGPYGLKRFWFVPSLAWFNSNDIFLVGLCWAGIGFSLALLLNRMSRFSLFALWFLYLSIVSVGGDFANFQWDALLLETGLLAIFLSPKGPTVFLVKWLLFRLMIQSALVKWLSGDVLWRSFKALTVHYQTQPLPNPLSWFAHQLPVGFQQLCCVGLFVIEGLVPFLIFAPRRLRLLAFWTLVSLQGEILLTGNYTYFNLLAIVLCLILLDDSSLRPYIHGSVEGSRPPRGHRVLAVVVVLLTFVPFSRTLEIGLPRWLSAPSQWVWPLRSFNSYGLFAVMTPERPEIILEGTRDGKTWIPYEFKYKPGDINRRPQQVAPYQPRLDWQMWFAALGNYRQNPWFMNLCVRLLQGKPEVLRLLQTNPFSEQPPVAVRASLYIYRFTTPEERSKTGAWWVREYKGLYCPAVSLSREA